MFDLTSTKLLILGLVALIVVGPKDLPVLLRTLGRYVGILRKQANEFRAQFDAAMREQELDSLRSEIDALKRDVTATVHAAGRSLEGDSSSAMRDLDNSIRAPVATVVPPPPELTPEAHEPAMHINGTTAAATLTDATPKSGA